MAKKAANHPNPVTLPGAGSGPPWTVMVYMAAHLTPELDAHAVRDLREMERAKITNGVRVVVQMNRNWPRQPQRYEIKATGTEQVPFEPKGKGTGDPESLEGFLRWTLTRDATTKGKRVARRYFLVLWGHAYGLGFGRDHGDPLTLRELADALQTLRSLRGGRRLELLGANACALAYAEAAFELKDQVDCLVASQISVPFAGWPFETVVGAISPGVNGLDIGKLVVDRYVSTFRAAGTGEFVAMSLLNLRALDRPLPRGAGTFKQEFDGFAATILNMVDGREAGASDRLAHMRAAMLSAGVGDVRPLIDLRDLCARVRDVATDVAVLQPFAPSYKALARAADRLEVFLTPPAADESPRRASRRFLAAYHQTGEHRGLNGIGIYVPFVTDPADLKRLGLGSEDRAEGPQVRTRKPGEPKTGRETYQALQLMASSEWDTLVYDTLRAGLPGEVVDSIGSSGATTRAQRTEVTQMLVAVDSLFDVLDRRIAAVRSVTRGALPKSGTTGRPRQPNPFLQLQLIRHEDVRRIADTRPRRAPKPTKALPANVWKAINAFLSLETTLGDLERSVSRTLTNGTYGLGPGPGGSAASLTRLGDGKGGGHGADPDKGGGHGAPEDKGGGHGAGDDKGGGHGVPLARAASLALKAIAATPAAGVAALFAEVGAALHDLEAATSEAETLLATVVTTGGAVVNSGPPNAMQIDRAFRILAEASTQARRTLRQVLAHPVYGFGPGLEGVTAEDRRELARVGGLSSMALSLL